MTEMKWNTNYGNYVYRVPEGLRELCSDISREVLRTQPKNIYCFIADYIDGRLARQEKTKIAMKIVNNVLRDGEFIVNKLNCMGFDVKQIAAAAPKLQHAFRSYLDDIKTQSLENADETSGIPSDDAENATTEIPQQAFRENYSRMQTNITDTEPRSAKVKTIEILCKADISSVKKRSRCSYVNSGEMK